VTSKLLQAAFVALESPRTPFPEADVQLVQVEVLALPEDRVPVQTGEPTGGPPDSVMLMGANSDPSVRSVQLFAMRVPLMSTYGPGFLMKRVEGDSFSSDNHARYVPVRPAPSARRLQMKSAPSSPPRFAE
jgi:hypothetical protein